MPQQHNKPDTFKERFARAVQQSLDRAGKLAPGPQRDILLAKIRQLRQLEAVAAMNNVYRFPRRRPPRRPFKRRVKVGPIDVWLWYINRIVTRVRVICSVIFVPSYLNQIS